MSIIFLTITTFLLGIALNGLFAGYETGFISVDKIRIRYLAEEEDDVRAKRLLRDIARPDSMLTVVLIGTNVSLIFGTLALTKQIPQAWLSTLIATPMYLVFAEIIPKSVFRKHPTRLSLVFFPVIRFFEILLMPLTVPTVWCVKAMRFVMGVSSDSESSIMNSEDDLRNLIDESAARGSIEKGEQKMIHGVMNLQTTQAKEIMVPRTEIKALPVTATRDELIQMFQETGLTRILIYEDTIDTILGVANVYDVMQDFESETGSIESFVREVTHVPETKPIDDLLQVLKQRSEHLAIVTDEYGGTDGLITLEDVLEEIFGEIHDEHDEALEMIQKVGPRNYVVDARMPLEELSEAVNMDIADEEVETVGGWVMHMAGRIPTQGEKINYNDFRVVILEGNKKRVIKIRLDLLGRSKETS
jgi:putative hemolysin